MKKLFRWRAIVPLVLVLLTMALIWYMVADRVVESSVEDTGADLVGAKVDVQSADLRLGEGKVSLTGLAVANPNSPMQNLFEAEEVVADVRMKPLLTKKLVIEQIAVRGMRLGTPRETSGALGGSRGSGGHLAQQIAEWQRAVRVPPLNLEGLGSVVNVQAINVDSLRTLAQARGLAANADSMRRRLEADLNAIDPKPLLDSARALAARVSAANPLRLGVAGTAELVASSRRAITALSQTQARIAQLDSTARGNVQELRRGAEQLAQARLDDYAYARRLLQLPSLDAPELTPPAFADAMAARVAPILYWVNRIGDLLPPGLDPRRHVGRNRARRSGVTVAFPKPGEYPRFLLELAEIDLDIGGNQAAAGRYTGRLTGLTSSPTLYGQPMVVSLERSGGVRGPRDVSVAALLDHTTRPIRDSLRVRIGNTAFPTIDLPSVRAKIGLGTGTSALELSRVADTLAGVWRWRTDSVTWSRLLPNDSARGTGQVVVRAVEDALWRALSSLRAVELDLRLAGSVRSPRVSISSNVGRVVAQALRAEVGRELAQAEQKIRAEVDRQIGAARAAALGKIDNLESDLATRIGIDREQLAVVRGELEQAIRRLTGGVIPR